MNIFQRIRNVCIGILTLLCAIILITEPTDAYTFVIGVLALGLTFTGIKYLAYYFSMARHMVGGKMILFRGVIMLDFALLTGSLADVPKIYILLYLVAIHAFSGVVEVLRAMEAKRTVGGPWKMKFSQGVVDFLIALSCFVFIRNTNTTVIIFGIGLMYSSIMRIIGAFRRTTFILIE